MLLPVITKGSGKVTWYATSITVPNGIVPIFRGKLIKTGGAKIGGVYVTTIFEIVP